MSHVAGAEHRAAAGRVRELLATYERQRDLILLGAYKMGSDKRVDEAIARVDAIEGFLKQRSGESSMLAATLDQLRVLAR